VVQAVTALLEHLETTTQDKLAVQATLVQT
jgi:hypothetical protein